LDQLEEALQTLRIVWKNWLSIGQAILAPDNGVLILILGHILILHPLLNPQALIKVAGLIDVAIQNARVQFATGIVHCLYIDNNNKLKKGNCNNIRHSLVTLIYFIYPYI